MVRSCLKKIDLFVFMYTCVHVNAFHVCGVHRGCRKASDSTELQVFVSFWELNSGPLEKQEVLFTADLLLSPLASYYL